MRLSDTFMKLMSYTAHLLQGFEAGEAADYESVRQRFDALYQEARSDGRDTDCSDEDWQEAWFAVAIWIDEMILCSDWPEKKKWESAQLQRLYFQTTRGGEEFFTRLSALSRGKGDVREVYLYCLAMRFKGRYFSSEDEKQLAEIYRANLALLHEQRQPSEELLLVDSLEPKTALPLQLLEPGDNLDILFPDAYEATSRRKKRRVWRHGFSLLNVAVMGTALALLILLFVSYKNNLNHLVQNYVLGA